MLVLTEMDVDFSEGCALPVIDYTFLVTHPHHATVREWLYARTVSGDSRRSESLFTAPMSCAWQ